MENTARDLLNGIKVKKDNTWYLVGNLARKNGVSPSRITNATPAEEDFDILFKAALINLSGKLQQPVTVTIGFPFSTYHAFKTIAEQYLAKRHFMVEYDTQTFNVKGNVKKEAFDIERFEVIPEIVGGIIGLKKIFAHAIPKNFMAISFGFGTLEGIMATEDGLVQRTSFSTHGVRYAINNLARELNKKYYLELKNEHQLDEAFMKGSLFANRKRIDITDIRKEVLEQYYRKVVSPAIRSHLTDADLDACEKIYLLGGGAYYSELTNIFIEEFKDLIPVEVAPEPEKTASTGYLYNSLRLSDNYPSRCAGIDLGNAFSMVSFFSESLQPDFKL
ncbi:MAG: ParM/StbA family protein [Chitinophagaceae bacterium]